MQEYIDIAAAVCAFIAASFWFLSAYGKLPPLLSYYGSVPDNDPFYLAVKFSAIMNKYAAGFSGMSALCMGLKLFLS